MTQVNDKGYKKNLNYISHCLQWKRKGRHRSSRSVDHDDLDENVWIVSLQVFIPFLVAGLGMVGAGLVLDVVQVRLLPILNLCHSLPVNAIAGNHG